MVKSDSEIRSNIQWYPAAFTSVWFGICFVNLGALLPDYFILVRIK